MGAAARLWNEAEHPRGPGGRFISTGSAKKGTARAKMVTAEATATAKAAGDTHRTARSLMSRGDLERQTVPQLREQAKQIGHKGHSRYRKTELVDLLAGGKRPEPEPKKASAKPATGAAALSAAPIQVRNERFVRGVDRKLGRKLDVEAFNLYAGDGFYHMNNELRDGGAYGTPHSGAAHRIDIAMEHSKLTRDVFVHRGVADLAMFGAQNRKRRNLVGLEFREAGFSSTTADPHVAHQFFEPEASLGEKGAVLNIRVPAGTGAVQLSELGVRPRAGESYPYEYEAELLLERNLTYRVVGDRTVNGVRYLDVEVVGG